MQAGQSSKTLTIAAPRDFFAKWLAPRLADFAKSDRELRFVLLSSDDGLDFTQANLDLAVCFAKDKGEHEGVALGSAGFVTVGAKGGAETAISWPGCPSEGAKDAGLTVGDAGLALDAAAAGFGRATVPALLVEAEIAAGRVTRFGEEPSEEGYWLIAPLPQWRQKKVRALVSALTA
jgi:LysR family glycine cleavage system transcriptional activator